MKAIDIITIDGPTASGKGTVAERVAKALSFAYLDSGALYRLVALSALRRKIAFEDARGLAEAALAMRPKFEADRVFLEGEDVTEAIRAEEVSVAASRVAAVPEVRQALVALQKSFAKAPGLVADGRDMGTAIFPEAVLKVYLTATPQARAARRYKQLKDKGVSVTIESLVRNLEERDARDMQREASPLVKASEAMVLDSSELSVDETVERVLAWYRTRKDTH